MATKNEEKQQEAQQEAQQATKSAPQPTEVYVFNTKTGLVGYTFADGKKFKAGVRYALSAEEAEKYAHKRPSAAGGHQVLVKE